MSGGISNLGSTPPGGNLAVTLPQLNVGPGLPDPGPALPGNGSYGDPIAGFRQINQQFADSHRAFSERANAQSAQANAQLQAWSDARSAQAQAQSEAMTARMSTQRAAMEAPPITGPMLPPNFLAAARAPAPPVVPGLLALGTPAAEAAPADGGTAEAAAPPGPETAAGPALAAAAAAPAAGPGGIVAVGKEAAGGLSRLAGSAAARAVPVLGTLGQILRSDPAQGPGLGPEQEALVGRRPFDPTPLAEQAVAASKPLLADGFAAPGVSGAVFSLRPDVALAPLPGFAPAVPDLGTEGVTVLPDTGAPLPGLARAT